MKKRIKKIKKNTILGLIKSPLKGPVNKPIIFNSITEGMEYFKDFNKNKKA